MAEPLDNETLRQEIARRAYLRFCDRGCVHGGDTDDWLMAEREVLGEQQLPVEAPAAQDTAPPPRQRNARHRQ